MDRVGHGNGRRVHIAWDGCDRRMLELSTFGKRLHSGGYELVPKPQDADIILVGTCAFKEKEEDESVERVRALCQFDARVLVYGCLPDIAPPRMAEFEGVEYFAPKDLDRFDELFDVGERAPSGPSGANVITYYDQAGFLKRGWRRILSRDTYTKENLSRGAEALGAYVRSRVFGLPGDYRLFICRGCTGKCAYCAIKYAVGGPKSKPLDVVLEEFSQGIDQGYEDFAIIGDDVGCYGVDLGMSLPDALEAVLEQAHAFSGNGNGAGYSHAASIRLRLNELHPKWMVKYRDRMLRALANKHMARLLCPLESGSDRLLELMRREHTAAEVRDILRDVRQANPRLTMDTQIIVGFPSETEEDLRQTLDVIKHVGFDSVTVFPYHEKPNTPAAKIEDKVPAPVTRERVKRAMKALRRSGVKAYSKCPR